MITTTSCGDFIKKDKKMENFGAKADMLGLDLKQQVEMLNGMMQGKVKFDYTERGIYISSFDNSLVSIELPETSLYDINDLFSSQSIYYQKSLVSVKLPKTLDDIELRQCHWLSQIERLFLWDNTNINFIGFNNNEHYSFSDNSGLSMIIIQSTTGKKPVIYNLK